MSLATTLRAFLATVGRSFGISSPQANGISSLPAKPKSGVSKPAKPDWKH